MVIAVLLLIALACLVVGLVLANAAWLIASLIGSAGAAYLLFRARRSLPWHAGASSRPAEDAAGASAPAPTESLAEAEPPTDAQPATPTADAPTDAESAPATADAPIEVAPVTATAPTGAPVSREVWVIDGRPRYHLGDCAIIQGQNAEPIPWEQATEDGFMPCSLCEPDAARDASAAELH